MTSHPLLDSLSVDALTDAFYHSKYGNNCVDALVEYPYKDTLDFHMVQWMDSFWGMIPEEIKYRSKVGGAWAKCLDCVTKVQLRNSAVWLFSKAPERETFNKISKGRDLLGQFYYTMALFGFNEMVTIWEEVLLSGNSPLYHKELALNALLSSDEERGLQALRSLIDVLKRGKLSKAKYTEINNFLRLISTVTPIAHKVIAEEWA